MRMCTSELFKILGVETRLKIIALLKSKNSLGVKEIAEVLNISPSAVSQHLRILRQAGLVKSRREGYYIPYSLDEDVLENCRDILDEICSCRCHGVRRFRGKRLNGMSLTSLKKYEKKLERELEDVRGQVFEIESQGK